MKSDRDLLRQLHKVQISVPDQDFFNNLKNEYSADSKKKRKGKGTFFSTAPFIGSKKSARVDIEIAREKIKSFNNSFKTRRRREQNEKSLEPGLMGIQEMNEYRNMIKEAAEAEEIGYDFQALEGIIKFIDLKNSGIVTNKQDILLDCMKHLGLVLLQDGGLSMFHATWFYTIYKEYLGHFRMFRKGEYERAAGVSSKEVKEITKTLVRKQYELPQYLQLVNESKRDIKQLLRYSKDPYVKRSIHGQRGCSVQHIRKIFQEKLRADDQKSAEQIYANEISIFMSYAMFFTRFPMMHPLVEILVRSIPNLSTETTLYKEKIMIALKMVQVDILMNTAKNVGSDIYKKRLFDNAYSVYRRCVNLITDNRLTKESLKKDILAFPFLKQAVILITYKEVFETNSSTYLKMIENSRIILKTLTEAALGPQKHLVKTREFVELYERNLDAIVAQIQMDRDSDAQAKPKRVAN